MIVSFQLGFEVLVRLAPLGLGSPGLRTDLVVKLLDAG